MDSFWVRGDLRTCVFSKTLLSCARKAGFAPKIAKYFLCFA